LYLISEKNLLVVVQGVVTLNWTRSSANGTVCASIVLSRCTLWHFSGRKSVDGYSTTFT